MNSRRVVVTGLGLISPVGNSVAEGWKNLLAGRTGIANITKFDASAYACRFAGEVKGFNVEDYFPAKEARHMDAFIHYGLAASIQAVKDAGLPTNAELGEEEAQRIGCLVGSGIGGLPLIEDTHAELEKRGPRRITPFFVPASIINMISGHVSITFGFQGPNLAIVTACTTGLHSIGMAGRLIEHGDADVMVAGGAEATVSPLGIGGFAAARALSTRNDDPATASRPWDKDRDGFVLGEGAGVLVLEEYEHAKRRGAKIYAELVGFGMGADAFHMTAPNVDGPKRSMQAALRSAQINRRPGPVPQRARHLDPARRRQREQRDQAGVRRSREEARRQLHEIDDRALARRRRRDRIGVLGAGAARAGVAADHQHLQPGPGVRSRLLRQRGAADEDRVRRQEQLRVRRHQRHPRLQAGLSALRRPCASASTSR